MQKRDWWIVSLKYAFCWEHFPSILKSSIEAVLYVLSMDTHDLLVEFFCLFAKYDAQWIIPLYWEHRGFTSSLHRPSDEVRNSVSMHGYILPVLTFSSFILIINCLTHDLFMKQPNYGWKYVHLWAYCTFIT